MSKRLSAYLEPQLRAIVKVLEGNFEDTGTDEKIVSRVMQEADSGNKKEDCYMDKETAETECWNGNNNKQILVVTSVKSASYDEFGKCYP